ncbi:MAG: MFS transporter [Firmicutes bacterium]|nr:MFS transporter [Alicyclobacillaceae bacterium]MCL6497574.1 MFS transporter [Bacillota bacterium]
MPPRKPEVPLTTGHLVLMSILGLAEFSRGALLISLLPAYITGPLAAPLILAGWAVSSHYFLDTVCRGPAGWLVDRVGPARVLTLGLAIEVMALVGAMNTRHPDLVVLFVAVLGVGTASHWPAVVTGVTRLTPSQQRASVMGLVFATWLTGAGIGPVAINFLLGGRDRLAFLILVGADVVAFVATILLTDPRLGAQVRESVHPGRWVRVLWPYRTIIPGMFLQNMTLGLMMPILQPFTHQVLRLSQWRFAELLLGSGAFTVLLLVPMGRITDRFGLKVPLVGGFFLAGLSLVGLGLIRQFLLVVLIGGLAGLAYAMILPAWNAFLANQIPKEIEGWLWGVFMTVEGLGMAVGPVVGARLFEMAVWAPFLTSAGVLLLMGAYYLWFPVGTVRAG